MAGTLTRFGVIDEWHLEKAQLRAVETLAIPVRRSFLKIL
jgi:hypothetical protein